MQKFDSSKVIFTNFLPKLRSENSRIRSFAKAFTWRITATLTTFLIALVITGELDTAVTIGGIEFFVKFFVYYAHERLWILIR